MKIDQVIRSNRKTISILVYPDGRVVVRAPLHAQQTRIQAFVTEKAGWIQKKLAEAQRKAGQAPAHTFMNGELFLFLGQLYPLGYRASNETKPEKVQLIFKGDSFLMDPTTEDAARLLFTAWYKKQARRVLQERADLYAKKFNLHFQRLRITAARTRWGSCSSLGTLSFTWRLVMAPLDVIDYLVIHELAHLTEKNHSRRFWNRVEAMLPDFRRYETWLKEHGRRLTLE